MSRAGPAATPLAAPRSTGELFTAFTWLSLQGFGGVLPVAQRELVERRRWLSRDEFLEMLSVAQVLPGPNVVNLALMYGDRTFGLRGAFFALAGMIAVPMVLVLALTALYAQWVQHPMASGALRGMGAVAAGLVLSTGIKLAGAVRRNLMGVRVCAAFVVATVVAIAWWRLPLVWVVLALGSVAVAVARRAVPR